MSGFVPKMEIMYLTMGGCAGLGYGLSFSPCSTIISYYFKKHRALANGIVVSGSGIGALTYPAIYSFLIKKYGLHGTFWVIGGILLNVCVAACVFKQPKLLLKEKESQESTGSRKDQELLLKKGLDKQKSKDTLTNCYGLDFRFSLFRNPRFSMYCVSFVLCMNGYGNNLIMIPAHIKDVGYDTTHAVYGVTIMGGCEVVARIAFGLIADRNIMKRKHIFLFSMLIASVFSFIAPFFDSFVFLGIYAGVIGTFPGSFWSLVSVLIIDVVGMEDFAPAFGLVMLCLALGVVISQPAVGWLKDYTGNWHASLILTGCLFLLAGLLISFEQYILRFFKKQPVPTVDITIVTEFPLKNNQTIKPADDTDSLLDENGDIFTSSRISRTYTPYDTEQYQSNKQDLQVPVVDTNDV
ncbi:monocarboxylate transporter 12-B-like isoform X2 [Ruditapes philippinarum]|uniref:monocarboxylate transporter 12-B-like isoform X2 n=1 Tax=Ruditapes philippinarum TaxID=129788 RepID=UPI00295C35DF|nr:monocarboxylate transporter 12-B-like isoform X2 [Ruditapes philippinarum]